MKKIIVLFFAVLFSCSPTTWVWGQQTRAEQLFSLQQQARQHMQQNPYMRDLLLYISAMVLWASMEQIPMQQFKMALTQELKTISPKDPLPHPYASSRQMFAKKKPASDVGQLSLFPPEPESAPVAEKPAPVKEKDLSWIEQPEEPLRPTRKPQEGTLFPQTGPNKQPRKSYLSRRVEERYAHTSYFHKLSQEEIAGLFERLDQAVAINAKSGKMHAHKFLSEMANKYPKAQILFIQAKHLLLGGLLLIVADQLIDFSLDHQMMNRLARNPHLFLEASAEELAVLAEDPQAVQYAQFLVASLEEMASVSVSEEEIDYIRSVTRQTHSPLYEHQARHSVTY